MLYVVLSCRHSTLSTGNTQPDLTTRLNILSLISPNVSQPRHLHHLGQEDRADKPKDSWLLVEQYHHSCIIRNVGIKTSSAVTLDCDYRYIIS